jgi:hypothetical protein
MGIEAGTFSRFPPVAVDYTKIAVSELGKRDVLESHRQMKGVVISLRLGSVREPVNLTLLDRVIVGIVYHARYLTMRI